MADNKARAEKLLRILNADRDSILLTVDNYIHGIHEPPYTPPQADAEFKQLAQRCVTNWIPTPINATAQGMAVDGFRPGEAGTETEVGKEGTLNLTRTPQWDFWQRSRLDARQSAVYRSALGYGHAFVRVYKGEDGKSYARSLSPLRTTALFTDPANDEAPVAVLEIVKWASENEGITTAILTDERYDYEVRFEGAEATISNGVLHGADECPVVRFAAAVDLDGRTIGLVEPLIPLQNRINQSVFDLLVAQTYGSFKVRVVTGMAPPMQTEPVRDETGAIVGTKVKINPNTGQPMPAPVNLTAAKVLWGEDKDTRFDTLDETPLNGYIESIDMSIRHFSAISQTPPHFMLGQIANLSAEALAAAEQSLSRKVEEFKKIFGESWERVFRLAMSIENVKGDDDYHGEVIWRDLGASAFSEVADGLGKMAENLAIPRRGLWSRVPGISQNELALWEKLWEEEQKDLAIADALYRATGNRNVDVAGPDDAGDEPPAMSMA